jgi:hypothetical protein
VIENGRHFFVSSGVGPSIIPVPFGRRIAMLELHGE